MKRLIVYSIFIVVLLLTSCSSSKRMSSDIKPYSIETMGVGNDGTYVVKVTDYFRTVDEKAYLDCLKKDAVHSVIYHGVPAGNGSMKQPALMTEDTRIDGNEQALHEFFEQKQYQSFVSSIVNSSKTITKIKGSKNYKISVIMSVDKDDLRKYLIDNGIIKSLDYLF